MITFLHTSDLHLGMRRHYLTEESEPRYRQARLDALATIGRVAVEEGCAFILVAGDFLESNQVDLQTVSRAAEVLSRIPLPVYLLPGNHDAADASSMLCGPAFERMRPPNVRVLRDATPLEVAPGVELVPAPLRTRHPLGDLVGGAVRSLAPGPLRIVLGHGMVDRLSPDSADPARIRVADAEAALAEGRIHYLALGDRHSSTSVGTSGRIRYSGSPEPTDFDEERAGYALVVRLSREEISVRERAVGHWTFHRMEHDFAGEEDVTAFGELLQALPAKEVRVVRLALRGRLTLREHAHLEEVLDEARRRFASISISARRSDLQIVPADSDFGALDLIGFARGAVDELRDAATGTDAGAGTARDALALLMQLAGRSA